MEQVVDKEINLDYLIKDGKKYLKFKRLTDDNEKLQNTPKCRNRTKTNLIFKI